MRDLHTERARRESQLELKILGWQILGLLFALTMLVCEIIGIYSVVTDHPKWWIWWLSAIFSYALFKYIEMIVRDLESER